MPVCGDAEPQLRTAPLHPELPGPGSLNPSPSARYSQAQTEGLLRSGGNTSSNLRTGYTSTTAVMTRRTTLRCKCLYIQVPGQPSVSNSWTRQT